MLFYSGMILLLWIIFSYFKSLTRKSYKLCSNFLNFTYISGTKIFSTDPSIKRDLDVVDHQSIAMDFVG